MNFYLIVLIIVLLLASQFYKKKLIRFLERPVVLTARGNKLKIKPIETKEAFVKYTAFPNSCNREKGTVTTYNIIDFETANMYPDSICQMGITQVVDNKITSTKTFLIRPPYNKFTNTKIHGIDLSMVAKEATFLELWDEIKPYIENKYIAAYNMPFDFGCLEATIHTFDIASPDYVAFDILENARLALPNLKNHKLASVAKHLKIDITQAHDAGDDSLVAAQVQLAISANALSYASLLTFKINDSELYKDMRLKSLSAKDAITQAQNICAKIDSTTFEDYKEAKPYFDRVEELNYADAPFYRFYGELLEKCNCNSDAILRYEKALAIDKNIGLKQKLAKLIQEQAN